MKDKKVADDQQKIVAVDKKEVEKVLTEANILKKEALDGVADANKKL